MASWMKTTKMKRALRDGRIKRRKTKKARRRIKTLKAEGHIM